MCVCSLTTFEDKNKIIHTHIYDYLWNFLNCIPAISTLTCKIFIWFSKPILIFKKVKTREVCSHLHLSCFKNLHFKNMQ